MSVPAVGSKQPETSPNKTTILPLCEMVHALKLDKWINQLHLCLQSDSFCFLLCGVGDGQGSLVCCSPWGHKKSDTTEWLNWTELTSLREHMPFFDNHLYQFYSYLYKDEPEIYPMASINPHCSHKEWQNKVKTIQAWSIHTKRGTVFKCKFYLWRPFLCDSTLKLSSKRQI